MALVAIEPMREVADWLRLRGARLDLPIDVHPSLEHAAGRLGQGDVHFLAGFFEGGAADLRRNGRPGPTFLPFIPGSGTVEDHLDRWTLLVHAVRARIAQPDHASREGEPWVERSFEEEIELRHRDLLRRLNPVFLDLARRDPSIREHSFRVGVYAARVGEAMGLTAVEVRLLQLGGWVHDVGKTRIRTPILVKQGPLLPEEWGEMEKHPEWGSHLVGSQPADPEIAGMVEHHHERFDGKGYPARLAGEQIPLLARILAVADAYDAITSDRPYRAASGHRRAVREVLAGAGTQFDPVVVQAFLTARLDRISVGLFAA